MNPADVARELLKHDGYRVGPANLCLLAEDYLRLVEAAERALHEWGDMNGPTAVFERAMGDLRTALQGKEK